MRVIDTALVNRGHDIEVQLQRPAPAAQLESVARGVPDVEIAESVSARRRQPRYGRRRISRRARRTRILLSGYPVGTQLLKLPLREGRWPISTESDAVVVSRQVQEACPVCARALKSREISRAETNVRVAGIVEEIGSPVIYAAFPTFENITGLGDASFGFTSKGPGRPPATRCRGARAGVSRQRGSLRVSSTQERVPRVARRAFRRRRRRHEDVALASAAVGAISLIATVSLGVLERGREIGVIRALGAKPRSVVSIFLVEGGAVAVAERNVFNRAGGIFFAQLLNGMAERQLLHVAVPLYVSRTGLVLLSSGVVLVVLGVWLSVTRILRMSVRDALAYE